MGTPAGRCRRRHHRRRLRRRCSRPADRRSRYAWDPFYDVSMFSSRLPRSLAENRITQALAAARRPLLDLTESNPTVVGLALDSEGVLEALADPRSLTYTPTPRGLPEARAAVAGWYARHGALVDPERIFLTASTSEAYALLFKLLCDPGDRVLAPRPSYPLFDHLAALESVTLAHYPLRYHSGWFLDAEEVAHAVDDR